jgi:hypothetical protein
MTNLREIERTLRNDLERARVQQAAEQRTFRAAIDHAPIGYPPPDGAAAVIQASRTHRAAMENYSTALRRFTDFIVSGIVPDDLKQ